MNTLYYSLFIRSFFLIILVLPAINTSAQEYGKLGGFVRDSVTGEALPYCTLILEELKAGARTNEKGYFAITSIPANRTFTLNVTYIGYSPKSVKVRVEKDKMLKLNILLRSTGIEMPQITKYGERVIEKNSTDIGLERISIKGLENLPKGVELDVFRSLQMIPGVRTTGGCFCQILCTGRCQ